MPDETRQRSNPASLLQRSLGGLMVSLRSALANAIAILALFSLSACNIGGAGEAEVAESGVPGAGTKVDPGFNLLTPEQDVEIGRRTVEEIERQLPLVEHAEATSYVTALVEKLAANAPGHDFEYRVRVVDASDLNAFALPGGYLYINRGILESARSEGEVAGVLAHEIAHVALRHGTHNVSKAYLTQAGIGILGGILAGDSRSGAIIEMLGGAGVQALVLKYSRTAETQADITGAQILARSGYDPREMVRFFETLQKSAGSQAPTFFSDHPSPERRIERLTAEAKLLTVSEPRAVDRGQLRAVQSALASLPPAKPLEQLLAAGGTSPRSTQRQKVRLTRIPPPGAKMESFVAPDQTFRLGYPAQWEAYPDSMGSVTFAPPNGTAQIGDAVEIIYGAIVDEYQPISDEAVTRRMEEGSVSLQVANDDLVAVVRASSSHLEMVGEGGRVDEEGGAAIAVLRGVSPNSGVTERVTVATKRIDDGRIVYLLFVTPEAEAALYEPVLRRMFASIGVVSP